MRCQTDLFKFTPIFTRLIYTRYKLTANLLWHTAYWIIWCGPIIWDMGYCTNKGKYYSINNKKQRQSVYTRSLSVVAFQYYFELHTIIYVDSIHWIHLDTNLDSHVISLRLSQDVSTHCYAISPHVFVIFSFYWQKQSIIIDMWMDVFLSTIF